MTVVTIDLPDLIALGMRERAHHMGLPLEAVYTEALAAIAVGCNAAEYTGTVHERVAHMVTVDRLCDADIAGRMNTPPGTIARIRRSMGLPANRRTWRP